MSTLGTVSVSCSRTASARLQIGYDVQLHRSEAQFLIVSGKHGALWHRAKSFNRLWQHTQHVFCFCLSMGFVHNKKYIEIHKIRILNSCNSIHVYLLQA